MAGELEISPDVSEEIDADGDGGASSGRPVVDIGVLLPSHDRTPVRRRFDGGMAWLALAPWPWPWPWPWWPAWLGDRNCLVLSWSWSEMSSDAMDDSDDADEAILSRVCLQLGPGMREIKPEWKSKLR